MNLQIDSQTSISISPVPRRGELWNVSTQGESGKIPNNSFIAYTLMSYARGGTGGQNNWLRLEQPEIDLVMRVNGITSKSDRKWLWLVADLGTIYLTENGEDEKVATTLRWPRICIGSKDSLNRNRLRVVGTSGEYRKIEGIPKSSNYSKYTVEDYPEYFAHIWCSTLSGQITEVPNIGAMWMPIFDPASGFEIPSGGNALWLHYLYLRSKII